MQQRTNEETDAAQLSSARLTPSLSLSPNLQASSNSNQHSNMSTQEVYTAKLALASEDDEGGSGHNESSPLSLVAYSLTLSAQALFHAPMLYYRITR